MRQALAIDIGGGSVRAALVTPEGTLTAERADYGILDRTGPGGRQLDLDSLWQRVCRVVRDCLDGGTPTVVSVTTIRHAVVLIGADESVVWAASNLDQRGACYVPARDDARGQRSAALAGRWPSTLTSCGKLRALAEEHPDLVRGSTLLTLSGWLVWRLTGIMSAAPTSAAETGLFSVRDGDWSEELQRLRGVEHIRLPRLSAENAVVAPTNSVATTALRLTSAVPVVNAGSDTHAAVIGSGELNPGDTLLVAGTTTPVLRVLANPPEDRWGSLWTTPLADGRWACEGNVGMTGMVIDWLRRTLYSTVDPAAGFELLDRAARAVAPGSLETVALLGPRLVGDHLYRDRYREGPGLLVGDLAAFLSYPDGAGVLARSVLESCAFGVVANLARLETVAGPASGRLLACGGNTRLQLWLEMVATLVDRPIEVIGRSATLTGAGLLGLMAAGVELADSETGHRRIEVGEDRFALQSAYRRWLDHLAVGPDDTDAARIVYQRAATYEKGNPT